MIRRGALLAGARGPRILTLAGLACMAAGLRSLTLPEGPLAGGLPIWVAAATLLLWMAMQRLAAVGSQGRRPLANRIAVPALFGLWLLFLWEVGVRAFGVPVILLPPPSAIGEALATHAPVLWADFVQTVLRGALSGYLLGCGAGFGLALLADRFPFFGRGLLPLAKLTGAVPIVGLAPIMVMWFGFDWPSKTAVVAVMTLFPMLIHTLAGLAASETEQRELMLSYGAPRRMVLWKLRLPAALPMIFTGLKVNTTLALIGAIVAEFFGSPVVGMGFRISTEVSRMNTDLVWASIAVAALAGSLAYGGVALLERRLTFWHPSVRGS